MASEMASPVERGLLKWKGRQQVYIGMGRAQWEGAGRTASEVSSHR